MQLELEQPAEEYINLMERENNGITVILYWLRSKNACFITLVDTQKENSSFVPVAKENALDAFYHPFPYRDEYNKTQEPVEPEEAQ